MFLLKALIESECLFVFSSSPACSSQTSKEGPYFNRPSSVIASSGKALRRTLVDEHRSISCIFISCFSSANSDTDACRTGQSFHLGVVVLCEIDEFHT